jgi:hypothetical protein
LPLTEDSKNDAKGSAGDKHETALSMMHIEQEKLNYKLKWLQKAILDKIDPLKLRNHSGGKFSKSKRNILIPSLALPKINIEGVNVIALSPITTGKQVDGKCSRFHL